MSKVEDFIREHTKDDSNACWDDSTGFLNWSTPGKIRSAVDIAKKEIEELIKQEVKDEQGRRKSIDPRNKDLSYSLYRLCSSDFNYQHNTINKITGL